MTIKVALEHRTSYAFDRPVKIYPHVVRLRPAPHSRTPIEAYSLTIEPDDHFLNWQQDAFANYQARLVFPNPSTKLSITVSLIADLTAINPFDFFVEDWAENYGFEYPEDLRRDLEIYLRPAGVTEGEFSGAPIHPEVAVFAEKYRPTGKTRVIDFLVAINQAVCSAVNYTVRLEAGVQTPEYTLSSAIGSCRDSAWLLVALLRHLGLAARFVSGYLVQLTSDIKAIDGLGAAVDDGTDAASYGGQLRSGQPWTQAYVNTSSTLTAYLMRQVIGTATIGGNSPTIIVSRQEQYDRFWKILQDKQIFQTQGGGSAFQDVNAGFTNLFCEGIPWFVDSHVSDGANSSNSDILVLNERMFTLYVSPRGNLKIEDWQTPVDMDAITTKMLWAGNLVCKSPRTQAKLANITA